MNEKPQDRRVKKTKKALRQGLATLLAEKNLKDISVRELTDLADLHRGTFYVHYRDIYDLYAQLEEEVVEDVTRIFDEFALNALCPTPFPTLLNLIEYMKENADMCQMMFSENADKTFIQRLGALIQEKCIENWSVLQVSDDRVKMAYFSEYVVSGSIGVFRRWVSTGMEQSPKHLAGMIEDIAMGGAHFLKNLS